MRNAADDAQPTAIALVAAPGNPMRTAGWIALGVLLLAVFVLRVHAVVAHDPLVGLANNYDMIRVQGCIDVYPLRDDGVHPESNSWQAPLRWYHFRDDLAPGCFVSSEVLFAWALVPLARHAAERSADGRFSLRVFGVGRALILLGAVLIPVAWVALRHRDGGLALGALALAALLLADPGVTVYLNSLYAEFAAVVFAWLAVFATLVVIRHPDRSRAWSLLAALAIVGACTSKLQHLAFGLWLAASLALVLLRAGQWAARWRVLLALAIAAVLGAGIQTWNLHRDYTATISSANRTNVFLGAVLGSSASPAADARVLGLPEACAAHAGEDWFTPGVESAHPCPEVLHTSRRSLVALAVFSPQTVLRVLGEGLARTRPWIPQILGKLEGGVQSELPDRLPTLSRALDALPAALWLPCFLLPPVLALRALLSRPSAGRSLSGTWLLVFLGGFPALTLATVLFGDGFADVNKQFHLGMLAWLASWVVILGQGAHLLATWTRGRRPASG